MDTQALADQQAIQRGLGEFARILDEKRWDDLGTVFAHDITFDYGTGVEQAGMDALHATVTRFLEVCGPTQHLIGSLIIDVDGDHALSRAYVQARHQAADGGAAVFDTNGEYTDHWERRPGGWRIVRRDVTWAITSGDPAVIGLT